MKQNQAYFHKLMKEQFNSKDISPIVPPVHEAHHQRPERLLN